MVQSVHSRHERRATATRLERAGLDPATTVSVNEDRDRSSGIDNRFAALDRLRDDVLKRMDEHFVAFRRENRLLWLAVFTMSGLLMALLQSGVL